MNTATSSLSPSPLSSNKARGIGVGLKILFGVALVSNLCIGLLLYGHLRSGDTLAQKVDEVLLVKERLNDDLRQTIAKLQEDFLRLPELFKNGGTANLLATIEQTFPIAERLRLEGREAFSNHFDRNQRRDLAKGRHLILHDGEKIRIALPEVDEKGNFSEAITLLTLTGEGTSGDNIDRFFSELEKLNQAPNDDAMIHRKVEKLLETLGDAALSAESSRTEILRQVERIRTMEADVAQVRGQQRRFSLLMGGLAVAANLLALFFLTRTVVERPLRRLTEAVDGIAKGQAVEIPYGHRRDQIGVLAGALHGFSTARHALEAEGARREQEKQVMEGMLANLTETVTILDDRAKALADGASSLRQAAEATLERAEGVGRQARETAECSQGVADGATQLQKAVSAIDHRVAQQNHIAASLLNDNTEGQRHLAALDTSLAAISTILSTLTEINDQTKLLSLNATIEAATAGAAGRGFAVVANEVKALSQKTAEATREAKDRLAAINESRRVLVSHLNKVHGQIHSQEEHSRSIITAVAEQRQVSGIIANLAGESSTISGEASRSISQVAEEAAVSLRLAAEVQDAAGDISRRLGDLLEDGRNRLEGILRTPPANNESVPASHNSERQLRKPSSQAPSVPDFNDRRWSLGLRPSPQ